MPQWFSLSLSLSPNFWLQIKILFVQKYFDKNQTTKLTNIVKKKSQNIFFKKIRICETASFKPTTSCSRYSVLKWKQFSFDFFAESFNSLCFGLTLQQRNWRSIRRLLMTIWTPFVSIFITFNQKFMKNLDIGTCPELL